jgi:glucokinase
MMGHYYIGVDLGGTNIKTSVFNDDFKKVAEMRMATRVQLGSERVLKRMLTSIIDLLSQAHLQRKQIQAIGIGVPGLLDVERGISRFSPNFPSWHEVPVADWFQKQLHIPTFIDNDVRVNLYGEWYFGAGKGKKNIVLLTLGTGLGAGIVIDGRVLYGATGSAGEIGHMNMYRSGGRPCRCGSSGCLGRYVSALGMLRTFKEKLQAGEKSVITEWVNHDPQKITAQMISVAYDQDDPAAVRTMNETGELLGYGLVNIINLYNPELIIIGGGMSAAGDRLLEPARAVVADHALEISRQACSIRVAKLGDAAGMLGAAIYAKERLIYHRKL